jgi:hypothetical protein
MPANGALVAYDPEQLIQRIAEGAFLRDLAKELGIDKRRLSERLRQHPGYEEAKQECIDTQLEEAQKALREARDTTDIARARELFRAAAWRAEREHPARWGQKTHVLVENVGDLGERLRRALERDVSPTPVSLPTQVIDSTSTRES